MLLQRVGDLRLRLDDVREDAAPCLQHRIVLVVFEELDRAVVGVDGRLHRVADVADLAVGQRARRPVRVQRILRRLLEARALGVRHRRQGGVAVDDPLDPAVDDRRVGAGVRGQPRGDLLHALAGVTLVDDLRLWPDAVRQEDVDLLVPGGEDQALEDVAHAHAAGTVVGEVAAVGVVLEVRAVARAADDRVIRVGVGDDRAVVDARLLQLQVHAVRVLGLEQVGHGVQGVTAARRAGLRRDLVDPVGRGGDEAVAVGVHGVAVDPVLLVALQGLRVHLAGGDDEVAHLAVDLVAVDGQRLRETVEVLQLALLRERRRQHLGVEDADVRQGVGVLGDGLGALLLGGLVLFFLARHAPVALDRDLVVGQAVVVARRLDVAGDVLPLLRGAVRRHGELLDDQRPRHADDARGDQHEHRRHGRDGQVAQEDRREERRGHDQGDDQQHDLGGQQRVDVGVGTAGERLLAVAQHVVAVQPVGGGLEQHEHAGPRRQLGARGAGDPGLLAGGRVARADAAEHVVRHQRQQERHDDRQDGGVHQEAPERQIEGVEPQVLLELRVGLAEALAVEEQLHRPPTGLPHQAREQREHQRDADEHRLVRRLDHAAVDRLRALRVERARVMGTMPPRQPHRQEDDHADQRADEEEQDDPGHPRFGEDAAEAHLPEPLEIDVDVDYDGNEQSKDREDHHRGGEPPRFRHARASQSGRAGGQGVS